jgi:NAD(P)-dependent dehydrogenase (short-subunit alcohol dehydrogenase family)
MTEDVTTTSESAIEGFRPLAGKVALITGGAAGIGRAHALRLAKAGADVVVFDLGDGHRDAEPGYKLSRQADLDATVAAVEASGSRSLGVTGDVRDISALDAAVAATLAEFGQLDIVVSNAGVSRTERTWEMTPEVWNLIIDVNLTGAWNICRAAIPHMIERRSGRIVLTSSAAIFGKGGSGAYTASKAGVSALVRVLAAELGEYGITVNAVAASTVPGNISRGLADMQGVSHEALVETLSRARQLMPDFIEARDVANAVAFLASDQARMITGITLPVDGGVSAS